MYDFAHPIEDAIEGVTHSICTLEFEDHRPLYDWVVRELEYAHPPKQIEFAKLYLTNVVTGKRYIKKLVEDGIVDGWDDPRLVSIAALRRRGFTPESIQKFVELCGVSKANSSVDYAMLEYCIREDLKMKAPRMMAILDPVKVVIDNYPEGEMEYLEVPNNMENPELGSRQVPFGRELYIEREDFMEDAPKKYFRMTPGQEVRLKNAYIVKCTGCKKDENGIITEVYCEYDANTRSGMPDANRKVKGTLHWVSCNHCMQAEVRLYDRLWKVENPRDELAAIREAKNCDALEAMKDIINPDSLKVLPNCYIEKFAATLPPLSYLQFQRIGYFNIDKDSTPEKLIINRTVGFKDTWGKNIK